ncbi:uncharacterized protein LACBIDRAFT_249330, partial [Laccaria bicolor S238N-H82]
EPLRPPTPEPTISTYTRPEENVGVGDDAWREINVRLVGAHPLWGHYLWNAARAFATYLDTHKHLCRGRLVLELGAGGALPSIVTATNGAGKVVVTDYPDRELVENMEYNVKTNVPEHQRDRLNVQGYIWGHPVKPLLDALPTPSSKFDLIILSDLIFNHSQARMTQFPMEHEALLKTCEEALSSDSASSHPSVLVFYTHHRPHLAHRDMNFFTKARERGWRSEEILSETFPPMFPEDSGEEAVRSTVHGWRLTRRESVGT